MAFDTKELGLSDKVGSILMPQGDPFVDLLLIEATGVFGHVVVVLGCQCYAHC